MTVTLKPHQAEVELDTSLAEIQKTLSNCMLTAKFSNFWIGDLLNHILERHQDDAWQLVDNEDGSVSFDHLQRLLAVSRAVPPRVRKPKLSWTAHMQVAGLPEDAMTYLLDMAELHNWNSGQVAAAVKQYKKGNI